MPNRCVGESRRIYYYPEPNHFSKSYLPGELRFPGPLPILFEKLTFVSLDRAPVC